MKWFDGTFDYGLEELDDKFPVFIARDLRMSEDRKQVAVINGFPEDSEFLDLSDPKIDEPIPGTHVFFHAFIGEDAAAAKQATEEFLSKEHDPEDISLIRKEPDRIFMYSYGHICREMLSDQDKLRSLIVRTSVNGEDVFLLPLRIYMYECPVCGHHSLQYRDMFMICNECGWEDEGLNVDEEDIMSCGANGDWTIRQYRERYLQKKAADPGYYWHRQFEEKG